MTVIDNELPDPKNRRACAPGDMAGIFGDSAHEKMGIFGDSAHEKMGIFGDSAHEKMHVAPAPG